MTASITKSGVAASAEPAPEKGGVDMDFIRG